MQTELTFTTLVGRSHQRYLRFLNRWLPKAIAEVRKPPAEVSIVLVGDKKMAALHESFMNIPGTTDVLTFETEHSPRGKIIAGEIIICASYARREAKRRKIDPRHEVLLYALHGVLHLSGYDDLNDAAYRKMHKEEDRILQAIGIGAIFTKNTEKSADKRARRG